MYTLNSIWPFFKSIITIQIALNKMCLQQFRKTKPERKGLSRAGLTVEYPTPPTYIRENI